MERLREKGGKMFINYDKIKEKDPKLNFIDEDEDNENKNNDNDNHDDNNSLTKPETAEGETRLYLDTLNKSTNGDNVSLGRTYTLWSHDINNKFWDIGSYKKLVTVDNASGFWRVINNFSKIGVKFNHFFLMKNDVEPTWEHKDNRNGGVCSFKIELCRSADVFEYLSIKMVSGCLSSNSDDINGISLSPKNNWAIIKIWNKDSKYDLSKTLMPEILGKYSNLGIRYKANVPEY